MCVTSNYVLISVKLHHENGAQTERLQFDPNNGIRITLSAIQQTELQ
jgi:hypothetical protein